MTVLLTYASSQVAFLAADSLRKDMALQDRNWRVNKLHPADHSWAIAIGGVNIDRDKFAESIVAARLRGENIPKAANEIVPLLFEEKRSLMERNGQTQQFISYFCAEAKQHACEVFYHHLPSNQVTTVNGFDCMGPNTETLRRFANAAVVELGSRFDLSLDDWARAVITRAAQEWQDSVAFPIEMAVLRPQQPIVLRTVNDPSHWDGPAQQFKIRL